MENDHENGKVGIGKNVFKRFSTRYFWCYGRELPPQFLRKYLQIGSLAQQNSSFVAQGSRGLRAFKLSSTTEGYFVEDTRETSHGCAVSGSATLTKHSVCFISSIFAILSTRIPFTSYMKFANYSSQASRFSNEFKTRKLSKTSEK